jgi:hypothetical protein
MQLTTLLPLMLLLTSILASSSAELVNNVICSAAAEGCRSALPNNPTMNNMYDGIVSDYVCIVEKPSDTARFFFNSTGASVVTGIRVYASSSGVEIGRDPTSFIIEGLTDIGSWAIIASGRFDDDWSMGGIDRPSPDRNVNETAIVSSFEAGDPDLSYGEAIFGSTDGYSQYRVTFPTTSGYDPVHPHGEFLLRLSELELMGSFSEITVASRRLKENTTSPSYYPTYAPTISLPPTRNLVNSTQNTVRQTSASPTKQSTASPTTQPTASPTTQPTAAPTTQPMRQHNRQVRPTLSPTLSPALSPSLSPNGPSGVTLEPTCSPTA